MSVYDLIDATWPAASRCEVAGWTIREGQGGGSRVSAATWDGTGNADFGAMETACRAHGQPPIVMIRAGEDALDAELEARGYALRDPTVAMSVRAEIIAQPPPPTSSFDIWPPLAIQNEIWEAGGVGPERLAIMNRVQDPKVSLLGRMNERPAGSAFIGSDGSRAMLHALEVLPAFRRQGLAKIMMRHAGHWALDKGFEELFLLVTRENLPALKLYTSLNFAIVGHYHYRRMSA